VPTPQHEDYINFFFEAYINFFFLVFLDIVHDFLTSAWMILENAREEVAGIAARLEKVLAFQNGLESRFNNSIQGCQRARGSDSA
jgi:hypothetical protein